MNIKKPICKIEHKCPWKCKPIIGMYSPDLNLYGTNCILHTKCPREKWSHKRWQRRIK